MSPAVSEPAVSIMAYQYCGGLAQAVIGVGRDQRSYSTPGPVNTWMGDCLRAGTSSRYVTSHLGRLSLLPSAGR